MAMQRPVTTERIVRNPLVLSGEPIVRGTRISVRSIVIEAQEGRGADGALDAYPHLSEADVNDALSFYAAHRAEIDEYIRLNNAED